MTVQRTSGGYIVSDTILSHYVEEMYMYYTKREAVALFKEKHADLYTMQKEQQEEFLSNIFN